MNSCKVHCQKHLNMIYARHPNLKINMFTNLRRNISKIFMIAEQTTIEKLYRR